MSTGTNIPSTNTQATVFKTQVSTVSSSMEQQQHAIVEQQM